MTCGRMSQVFAMLRSLALCLLVLAFAGWAAAQTTSADPSATPQAGSAPEAEATVRGPLAKAGPDYAVWEAFAGRIEDALSADGATSSFLEQTRAEIVRWRQRFLEAQDTNAVRIATLREQMGALGPVPAEGVTEAPEIAKRRADLTAQMNLLEAPGITAAEAYRRADGLIREIDRILRERQASELVKVWPIPLNPANWPSAFGALGDIWSGLRAELQDAVAQPTTGAALRGKLPAILGLVALGLVLILRARVLMDRLADKLPDFAAPRWVKVWSLLISLAQIFLPVLGILLLLAAVQTTALLGPLGKTATTSLATTGILTVAAHWLGQRIFAKDAAASPLRLGALQRAEGRWVATGLGLLVGLELLRHEMRSVRHIDDAAASVLSYPLLVLAGLSLLLLGQLLRRHVADELADGSATNLQLRMVGLLGRALMIIGVLGPVMATVGYVQAASALVYPASVSLGIVALLFILQQVIDQIYDLLTGRSPDATGALVPVLIGFAMSLAALPVLALVWGARVEDLAELWTGFSQGFSIGETRIAPTSFLIFGVIFAIGYAATRMLQATLRTSVLPRTSLDVGGRNAILAGVGYVGIFLAGLIAINSAGINLSGLAIVAGALSVGIGFGLQNIVQNFVSGIILLVERPVSEGDWIEVAGVQGIVQSISVRSTRIQTFDRSDVIVPNADLVSGKVTNWTRFNLTGRLIVPVSVAGSSDSRLVERVLREIAEAEPLVVLKPPPLIHFAGFGVDAMNFEIRVILSDVNFSLGVRTSINHAIVRRFREEGINLSLPPREVWVREIDRRTDDDPRLATAAVRKLPALPEDRSGNESGAEPERRT